jgi:hypothetical protein
MGQVTPQITDNPANEGTYRMKTPAGVQAVPYSSVERARAMPGTDFADFNEYSRYTKDHAYDPKPHEFNGISPLADVQPAIGAAKSAVQVPNTLVGWLDSITDKAAQVAGVANPESGDLRPKLEKAENAVAPGITNPTHGAGQAAGGFAETLAEWLYGEGEARAGYEALSQSEKLEKVAKAAKFIEAHPVLAATLRTSAMAAGSGGQAAAHGASAGDAAIAAGAGGAAGAAGELVGGAVKGARAAGAARTAAEAAPKVLAERTAAEGAARQATAQTSVKNVVGRATDEAFGRFNAGMATVPGFTEAVAPAAPKTFAEGSEALKDQVRPLYQRADAVTGYNGKLQELMAQHAAALDTGGDIDYKAADQAEIGIDELLEKRPADITPAEQAAMKLGWRDAKVLDKVHAATESSFNRISEERATEPGTGERLIKGGNEYGGSLQFNIGKIMDTPAKAKEVYRVLGRDGVANLDRAANLVSKPEMAKATAALAEQVAAEFPAPKEGNLHKVVGGAVGTGIGGTLGAATHLPYGAEAGALLGGKAGTMLSDGARDVMRRMVMSPRVGQMMDFAVRNNVSSKIAAGAVAAEIQREQGSRE